jgi:Protein of unknown function (DUF1018)
MKITTAQTKKIHALKRALALDDETYRAILGERFNVKSSTELDSIKAGILIEELAGKATAAGTWEKRTQPGRKYEDMDKRRGGMATSAQLRKIEAIWFEISRQPDDESRKAALRRFILRIAKVSDLRFLDRAGAGKMIDALNVMKEREEANAKKAA